MPGIVLQDMEHIVHLTQSPMSDQTLYFENPE